MNQETKEEEKKPLEVTVKLLEGEGIEIGTYYDPLITARILMEAAISLVPKIADWLHGEPMDVDPVMHHLSQDTILDSFHSYIDQASPIKRDHPRGINLNPLGL